MERETFWIDGNHTTVVLRFSFVELFAPFRGYLCLLSFLCALGYRFFFINREEKKEYQI
jgi:hypothetical protein